MMSTDPPGIMFVGFFGEKYLLAIAKYIIGASLSEPHTSVTALCTHVCMLVCLLVGLDRPLTVNFNERIQIFHNDGMSTPT